MTTGAADHDLTLRVHLLVNGRDHHSRTQTGQFQPLIEAPDPAQRRICTPDFTLRLWAVDGVIVDGVSWFENFDLPIEHERGLAHRDHHLCIGEAVLTLRPGIWTGVVASLHEDTSLDFDAALRRFLVREAELLAQVEAHVPELSGAPDWAQSARFSTERRRIIPVERPRRPGQWPACRKPDSDWSGSRAGMARCRQWVERVSSTPLRTGSDHRQQRLQ